MRYQPLKTTRGVVGVLGVKPIDPARHLTRDQLRTLDAFANQIGLAIERASLAEQARQAEVLEITDKLQTALLNSISHDLRTPLVSITGASEQPGGRPDRSGRIRTPQPDRNRRRGGRPAQPPGG